MSNLLSQARASLKALAVLMPVLLIAAPALSGPIENMKAGEWLEIPNSHLRDVLPSPVPTGDPVNIINAWSGGAFDSKRGRLIVWGGGHNDYCGNEVYSFDTTALKWSRLTDPSSTPIAVHSYDGLEYLPDQDQFFAAGGSTCSPGGNATNGTWTLDLTSNTWTQRQNMPGQYAQFYELGMVSAYDPVSHRVIMVGNHDTGSFDPVANAWRTDGNQVPSLDQDTTGELDPVQRVFVSIGIGTAYIFSVDSTGKFGPRQPLSSSGATEIEQQVAPGMAYDPTSGKIVAWSGGPYVYTLDTKTRVWSKLAATNSVNPGDPFATGQYRGTYGRWRYMPQYNAFIEVSSIDSNVFIYKLSDSAPVVNPTVTLSASSTTVAANGSATLTWSSSNATACTASNGWSGTEPVSGTATVGPLTATTTYTLTCTNSGGGSASSSVTVTVPSATPAPTISFSANPSSVASGGTATLSWSSTNATGCTASGGASGWSGSKAASGSANVGPFTATTTFNLSCSGAGGSAQASAAVAVVPMPTVSLTASPATLMAGGQSTLTWSSTDATACTAAGSWSGSKGSSGSASTGPLQTSASYSLTCTGTGGAATATTAITVGSAPPPAPPTVTLAAAASVVDAGASLQLSWSSANATSCMASNGWSGPKPMSGAQSVGPIDANTTFTLVCTGAAGSASQSTVVDIRTASAPPPAATITKGGGGAIDGAALASLFALLALSGLRRGGRAPGRLAAAVGALCAALVLAVLPERVLAVTADEDWAARSTAPGVVLAVGFDTQTEYSQGLWNQGRDNAWDTTVKASGAGALRFDIKTNTGEGAAGSWTSNFSKDLSVQFGANEEFWIQWRQRFDPFVITHHYQHLSGSGEWKQLDVSQGDMPGIISNSCSEAEMIMQNVSDRAYPSMYMECGNYNALENYIGNNQFTRQNQRLTSGGASNCQWVVPGDITGCLMYYPNEWMTFMIHVQLGPDGIAPSSISGSTSRKGFVNSTVEFYVAREGQPLQLAHRQTGITVPRGEHWDPSKGVDPNNPSDPGYTGGWGPSDGHPYAKYGKVWLLPFNTQKDPAETHPNASIWYDELIVSRQRIADPGASSAPPPGAPTVSLTTSTTSVTSGGSATLTWSSSGAASCTASGAWSGSESLSGSQSVGPLTATSSYTLTCTNSSGTSASQSVTVTVTSVSGAPTVSLSSDVASATSGSFANLSWTSSNASSCAGSGGVGGWAGTKATSGSQSVGPITATSTYSLACTGTGGTTQQSVTVQLASPPTVSLSASPQQLNSGATTMLSWSAPGATGCTASGAWAGTKAASGSEQSAGLSKSSTFALDCTGAGGTGSSSVMVTVLTASGASAPTTKGGGGAVDEATFAGLLVLALGRHLSRRRTDG